MLLWASVAVAVIAILTVIVMVIRRWHSIRLLDTDTIKEEQERKARDRIIRDRFERMLKRWTHPVRHASKQMTKRLTASLNEMESRLRHVTGMERSQQSELNLSGTRIDRLLNEAHTYAQDGKASRAERAYLEILKLNMRHPAAYIGLAGLYLQNRQYTQAKETYDFIQSMGIMNDEVCAGLATIAEAEGHTKRAHELRVKSLEYAPDAPLRHAELSRLCLRMGLGTEARTHAARATELDELNPQHLELFAETAILLRNRNEAEGLYERLRLMGFDRQRLRRLKEKLDDIS